jgi:hypothetical protein
VGKTTTRREGEQRILTLDLKGKKVIAIGERDGVQGQAIVAAVRSGGAEILLQVTQCFV